MPAALAHLGNPQTIYVIPRTGCSTCIDGAIEYSKKYVNSNGNNLVVFTDIMGAKELRIRLGDFYFHPSVYIDTFNYFFKPGSNDVIYPQIMKRESSRKYSVQRWNIGE